MSTPAQLFVLTEENRSIKGARWIREITERLQSLRCFNIANGTMIRAQNPDYLQEVANVNAINAGNVAAVAAGNQPAPVPPILADPRGDPIPPVPVPANAAAGIRDLFFNDRKHHMDVLKMLREDRKEYDDLESKGLQLLFDSIDESFKGTIPLVQRLSLFTFWTAIVNRVNQRTGTELAHLTSSYHLLKQTKDQSLEAYRLLRRDYEESLDNAGLPIPPQVQKSSFLSTLLPVYRNASDIYHDDPNMDIDRCLIALKGLELRINQTREQKVQSDSTIVKLKSEIKSLKSNNTGNTVSLNASASKKEYKKNNKSNVPLCEYCNMRGHTQDQCRGKSRPCDICQQAGHHRNRCPNKANARSASTNSNQPPGEQNDFALMTKVEGETDCQFHLSETLPFHDAAIDLSDYIISDSGCTHTCTKHPDFIISVINTDPHINLVMANGNKERVVSVGSVGFLDEVLLVNNLQSDLLSISQLDKKGCVTSYSNGQCIISKEGQIISVGVLFHKHYLHPKKDFNITGR